MYTISPTIYAHHGRFCGPYDGALFHDGGKHLNDIYRLHYGKSTKVLAEVFSDDEYEGMWRIRWPDGRASDMVNLSRAKDAAMVLAMREINSGDSRPLHWIRDTVESPAEASPVRPAFEEAGA